jgi:hypothetical protein
MEILSLVIDEIVNETVAEQKLSQQDRAKAAGIFSEIDSAIRNSEVGVDRHGTPTMTWLAGLLRQDASKWGATQAPVRDMQKGFINPGDDKYDNAVRTYIALQILARNNYLMARKKDVLDASGQEKSIVEFDFPSSSAKDKIYRDKLSRLRTYLSAPVHNDREQADLVSQTRSAGEQVIDAWVEHQSPEIQKLANIYRELGEKEFVLFSNLFYNRGPKTVANYRRIVNNARFDDNVALMNLQRLGLVQDDLLLNRRLATSFDEFLNEPKFSKIVFNLNPKLKEKLKTFQHDRHKAANPRPGYNPKDEMEDEVNLDQNREDGYEGDPNDPNLTADQSEDEKRAAYSRIADRQGGTKQTTRNDRAGGYSDTFQDIMRKSFNR